MGEKAETRESLGREIVPEDVVSSIRTVVESLSKFDVVFFPI
jgi:hypothetical protein